MFIVDQSKDKTKEKKKKAGAHAGGLEAKDSMIDQPEEGFSSKDEGGGIVLDFLFKDGSFPLFNRKIGILDVPDCHLNK